MKEKYNIFGIASAVYAVFLTFCFYQNAKGLTFPFFVAGTLCYFYYSMKKCGVLPKKDDWFYMVSLMLLGISVFLTMDLRIIAITKIGIFLLFISFLLHHFFDDSKWNFTKYLYAILEALVYTIGSLFAPVTDLFFYLQNKKDTKYDANGNELPKEESKFKYVLIGLGITIPLLFVILMCLSTADIVFADYLNQFFEMIRIGDIICIVIMAVAGYFLSYAAIHSMLKKDIKEDCADVRTKEPVLAITFTSVISVVYVLFSAIQIVYLFMGNMQLPEGYTYAEYAHQGFYQLLFVCILNVVILLICITLFKESNVLKVILSIITVCTYIMIASSAYRMYMYISAYGFTFLRLLVFFFLIMLSILMIGTFIATYNNHFPLFCYTMITITIFTIILSYSHPDYHIAKYNMNHDFVDSFYLTSLSDDAAPILYEFDNFKQLYPNDLYDGNEIDRYYVKNYFRFQRKDSIRKFNLSSYLAKKSFHSLSDSITINVNDEEFEYYNPNREDYDPDELYY